MYETLVLRQFVNLVFCMSICRIKVSLGLIPFRCTGLQTSLQLEFPPFEDYFATPQSVDFAKLCAAHQIEHSAVRELSQLNDLASDLPEQGIRVLEVTTDRKRDAAFRKKLFTQAAAKLA